MDFLDIDNIKWVFSGVGVFIIALLSRFYFNYRLPSLQVTGISLILYQIKDQEVIDRLQIAYKLKKSERDIEYSKIIEKALSLRDFRGAFLISKCIRRFPKREIEFERILNSILENMSKKEKLN